ncbi:phage tail tape measure protein [[Clostridium] colinum]|uniref:phage tail tape measure protein n=1 Tax=[Clostridium] colinum TaxID=36835 RepID=UPI002025515C|nr:phage tail tape measure protein [[Clostridium] colinum]
MANDGSVKIGVELDDTGLKTGLNNLQGTFKSGIAGLGKITSTVFSATTKAIGGVSAGIAGLGTASVNVGKEFESAMSKVQATSGASTEDLEKLKQTALEMGSSTKFSATESAEALNYMAMAGWKTEQMIGGIGGIMDLAAASGEDLAMVSDIVTDGLTAFTLKAKESGRFADVLAAASSNANTNVSMLGESFKFVAPVAGALGYSIEDTSVALGLMANAGIKASSSGTALRTLMTNLASPTKNSAKAMAELGLNIQDAEGNMLPFNDVMLQLRDGFNGLTKAEKAQYAEMLAGKEGMSGLLAIVNASQADFDKLTGAINDSSGAAAEMADIMSDNLQGRLKELSSKLENLQLKIYESIQEPLKEVTEYIIGLVTELQKAFDEGGFEGVLNSLSDILAKVLTDIAAKAPQLIEIATQFILNFLQGITENSSQLGQAGSQILTSLINGIFEILPQFIETAANLIINFQEGLIQNLPTLLESGKKMLENLAKGITENLPIILKNSSEILMQLVNGLIDNLPLIVNTGIDIILALVDSLVETLPELIPAAVEAILTIVDALMDNLDKIIDAAIELILALAVGLIDAIPLLLEKVPVIITKLVLAFKDPTMRVKLIDAGIQLILALIEGIINSTISIVKAVFDIGKEMVKTVLEFPKEFLNAGKDLIRGLIEGIKSMGSEIYNTLKNFCSGIVDNVKGFFGIHSPSRVFRDEIGKMLVKGTVVGVDSLSGELVDSLVSPYDEASTQIKEKSNQLENQYTSINPFDLEAVDSKQIDEMQKTLIQQIQKSFVEIKGILISNATETTNYIIEFLKSQITNLQKEFIDKLLKILPAELNKIGLMAITGFENGLTSRMENIKTQVSEFANDIIDEMQRALDIHSPSRKTEWLGEMLDEGLVKGIENGEKGILNTIKNLGIIDAFKQQIPNIQGVISNATNSMIPRSSQYVTNSMSSNNITNNQGDFVVNISGVELKNNMDVKTMLQEFSFYQKQRELAFGGV